MCAWLACLACLAVIVFLWTEHTLGWQHFRPEPFVTLMLVSLLGIVGSVVAALGRLVRRKGRWSDLLWVGLALLPVFLWTTVGITGASNWSRRHVPRDFLMELAKRSGASVMEGEAAWRYKETATPRCRMFGTGSVSAEADAERMDAYLQGLEQFTGRRLREPIHWIRGPLLGLQGGLSLYGLALGSAERPDPIAVNSPESPHLGLEYVDRHEAAHAFMAQSLATWSDPPTILTEGWAEALGRGDIRPDALSNDDRADFARNLEADQNRLLLSSLFEPSWYHQDSGPVYAYGRILVWYLTEKYGADRFLDLCGRIGPDRVESVFREIYGTTLPELEEAMFRAATERKTDESKESRDPTAAQAGS
jgi:hypothetical protein